MKIFFEKGADSGYIYNFLLYLVKKLICRNNKTKSRVHFVYCFAKKYKSQIKNYK